MSGEAEDGQEENKFSIYFESDYALSIFGHTTPMKEFLGFGWYFKFTRNREILTIAMFCKQIEKRNPRQQMIAYGSVVRVYPDEKELITGDPVKIEGINEKILEREMILHHANDPNYEARIPIRIRGDVLITILDLPPALDFSIPRAEFLSDVVLIVEDKEFHVCKATLASFSSYFKTMFFEKYLESEQDRIILEDIKADDFQELLEVIYHEKTVKLNNARELLDLVTYFDVKAVKKRCEEILVNCPETEISISEQMLLADKYALPELMIKCMESMHSLSQLKISAPKHVDELSTNTIKRLLQRVFDLPS